MDIGNFCDSYRRRGKIKYGMNYIRGSPEEPIKNVRGHKRNRFLGVRKRSWGKYVSEIYDPVTKRRKWLGSFDSAEEAFEAYRRELYNREALSADEATKSKVRQL
ncbi:hypothetical protein ACP70R_001124 [Stipagrostis hirtigluma subsp. patula]